MSFQAPIMGELSVNLSDTIIILVDDNQNHINLLLESFNSCVRPPQVIVAPCLNDARRQLDNFLPDLVITDLNLPDGSGTELLQNINEDLFVPFIVMADQGTAFEETLNKSSRIINFVIKSPSIFTDMPYIADGVIRTGKCLTEVRHTDRYNRRLEEALNSIKEIEQELENTKAQLHRSQRLETIGLMASGIAHDLNNMLTSIIGFTEIVVGTDRYDSQKGDLGDVLKAAGRARDLVKQILTFGRQVGHDRKPMLPHLLVEEAYRLAKVSIPNSVEINLDIYEKCNPILVDPTRISQVFINLYINAFHAMRNGGGTLDVILKMVEVDQRKICIRSELPPGSYVRLTVRDTGIGMAQDTIDNVFEPFFTTKEDGRGTGLGLSVAKEIISNHAGDIIVDSEVGKGTSFHVYLPTAEACETEIAVDDQPVCRGTETILLIDDDPAIARLGKVVLERHGYNVTAKTSSARALAEFRVFPKKFDIVITDQKMPDMSGEQLVTSIRRIRTDIPIIFTSGSMETISSRRREELGVVNFIMKPFQVHDFVHAIRKALDETYLTIK